MQRELVILILGSNRAEAIQIVKRLFPSDTAGFRG
jgi:hypothetical protein